MKIEVDFGTLEGHHQSCSNRTLFEWIEEHHQSYSNRINGIKFNGKNKTMQLKSFSRLASKAIVSSIIIIF